MLYTAYPKSGSQDPGLLVGLDPKSRTHPIGETRVSRPGNLNVGPKTRNPTHGWSLRLETSDLNGGTLDNMYF